MAVKRPVMMPTSDAKNAHALLDDVCVWVTEENKAINMRVYAAQPNDIYAPQGKPMCDAVGCIGGWVVLLKHPTTRHNSDIGAIAAKMLGASLSEHDNGFGGLRLFNPKGIDAPAGTKEHAEQVVARIRRYQKRHKTRLLAKKV